MLRVERDAARDAAARSAMDSERLTREAKRASASISASEQESQAERAALDSRCDRLARELEDAMVKVGPGARSLVSCVMYRPVSVSYCTHSTPQYDTHGEGEAAVR